jgi:diguanylate cyclase (GGDEF)-like protein
LSFLDAAQAMGARGWRRLRSPADVTEGTRWLFGLLALTTATVEIPLSLSLHNGWVLIMGLGSAGVLAAAWISSYLRRRVPWWLDLVEVAALLGFALASRVPVMIFGLILSTIWFRALYGSTRRLIARCAMYLGVIVSTFALWDVIPGHIAIANDGGNAGGLVLVPLTIVAASQLGRGQAAREKVLRGNAALGAAGSRLIGMTDGAAIRALGWDSAVQICAASPGIRLVRVRRSGRTLLVEAVDGKFDGAAAVLDAGLIDQTSATGPVLTDLGPLNLAAGATLAWVVLALPQLDDTWLLVGGTRVPADTLMAIGSLINQVTLALSNSDVHHELRTQATMDSLTGLVNRAAFNAELTADLGQLRDGAVLQVLFVDLDDFKHVNDLLGHRAGDLVLQEVALRLRQSTRPTDLCARLGGDEFAVILRGVTDAVAIEIARRAVTAVARPMRLDGHDTRVEASIGVATAVAGMELETAINHADIAMYAAKARGKGRVQSFRADLRTDVAPMNMFERELAAATAAGQLVVHYQPILTLPQLRCTAIEALVRWDHPRQGLLPPTDFITVAEQTGAIVEIGAFVLGRACADTVTWQRAHPGSPLSVHVNVSAKQLDDDEFITLVIHHLAESGLPASQLVLELTESVVLSGPAAVTRLRDLAGLGVQIAIDDFGTGYSSLTTLRSLPVNVIKLDRTFVEGALTNATDRAVITAIVEMSHQLGLHTIAEGVERIEQQQFLQDIHTDAVQGYLHLRPVPSAHLATWLTKNLHNEPEPFAVRMIRGAPA